METWRGVVGYEELFEVSNLGNFRRVGKAKNLRQVLHKTGYYLICTRPRGRKGKAKTFRVHREVAKAFLPNENDLPQVNHIDGCKSNNKLCNLEWVSASDNQIHSYRVLGRLPSCQKSRRGLTDSQVDFVLENFIPGNRDFGARALARKFNIHHSKVLKVVNQGGYKV